MTSSLLAHKVALAAALLWAGCARAPPPSPATPAALVPQGVGVCDPIEYPVGANQPASLVFSVDLDDAGRARYLVPTRIEGIDPAQVSALCSLGFADAAIDVLLHRCPFTPARVDGHPAPFMLVYTVNFELPR